MLDLSSLNIPLIIVCAVVIALAFFVLKLLLLYVLAKNIIRDAIFEAQVQFYDYVEECNSGANLNAQDLDDTK